MFEDFVAIALFEKKPKLDAVALEMKVRELESNVPLEVLESGTGEALLVRAGEVRMTMEPHTGPAPDEAVIPCLGMADLARHDVEKLQRNGGHVFLKCDKNTPMTSMDAMIALLKFSIALCDVGAWGVCLPAGGLCFIAAELRELEEMNRQGPRVWGIEEAEAETNLPAYEKHSLWNSLRREAQPAGLVVGFVPAEVEENTWFFSAGHSLFGLPEIAYMDGTLDDFQTIRDLFRFVFQFFYQRPELMSAGQVVKTDDSTLTLVLEELPKQYAEFQSPTGTLLVRVMDGESPDSDWD